MRNIEYKNDELYIENVSFNSIGKKYGTPVYVYSKKAFIDSFKEIQSNILDLDNLICFSIKTCSNINIIKILKEQGCGCDIVSGGELYRALKAGVDPNKIVFAGVGKTKDELEYALNAGILMFNCESIPEIELLNITAGELGKKAKIAIRVNPDVDAKTHAKITTGKKENKFGIAIDAAEEMYKKINEMDFIEAYGVHCHIGSQITTIEPYEKAINKVLNLIDSLKNNGIELKSINLGGGLGIKYEPDKSYIDLKAFGEMVKNKLKGRNLKLILEPGRYIAGNSGSLLVKISYIKDTGYKKFMITDGAMNDLIRPTLYEAYHHIVTANKKKTESVYDVVGPVCESGDYFGKDRALGDAEKDEYIVVLSAGAYGFSMASNYNSRVKPAELLVDGNEVIEIRKKETYADLVKSEL